MKLGKTAAERTRWSWWTRLPLACALLGVATTFAVALGSALWLPINARDGSSRHEQAVRERDPARGEGRGTILVDEWSRPGAAFYEIWVAPEAGPGQSTGAPTGARTPEQLLGGW